MIKKGTKKAKAILKVDEYSKVATYLTKNNNLEALNMETELANLKRNSTQCKEQIRNYERSIVGQKEQVIIYDKKAQEKEEEIKSMPPAKIYGEEEAKRDIEKIAELSFVERVEVINKYVVVTTKENSLFTHFNYRFNQLTGNWDSAKEPIRAPLPVYKIRLLLGVARTLSQQVEFLGISIPNFTEDSTGIDKRIEGSWYQEVHPHWASQTVINGTTYKCLCLGEYESDITNTFRKSIAEGFIALAEYLQMAGAENAYVSGTHGREVWGLSMGNKVFADLLLLSEKEVEEIKKEEAEERAKREEALKRQRQREEQERIESSEHARQLARAQAMLHAIGSGSSVQSDAEINY